MRRTCDNCERTLMGGGHVSGDGQRILCPRCSGHERTNNAPRITDPIRRLNHELANVLGSGATSRPFTGASSAEPDREDVTALRASSR